MGLPGTVRGSKYRPLKFSLSSLMWLNVHKWRSLTSQLKNKETFLRGGNQEIQSKTMIWRCVICCVFVALTLNALLSHINTAHSRSPDFHIVCGIDDCSNEYRVYNSLWYHVRRAHPEHLSVTGKGKLRRTYRTTLANTHREPTTELASIASSRWTYRPPENGEQR